MYNYTGYVSISFSFFHIDLLHIHIIYTDHVCKNHFNINRLNIFFFTANKLKVQITSCSEIGF